MEESEEEDGNQEVYKWSDSHRLHSLLAKSIHPTNESSVASFYKIISSTSSTDYHIAQQIINFEDTSIYDNQDVVQIIFSLILKNNYFLSLKHFDFVLSIIGCLKTYNFSLYSTNDIETFIRNAYSLNLKFFIRLYNLFLKLDSQFSQTFEECCPLAVLVQIGMDDDIPYILQIISKQNYIHEYQFIQSYILKVMDSNVYKLFSTELKLAILSSITQLMNSMNWKQLQNSLHENIFNHIIDDVMEENDEVYIIGFCKFVTSLEKSSEDNRRIVESIYMKFFRGSAIFVKFTNCGKNIIDNGRIRGSWELSDHV